MALPRQTDVPASSTAEMWTAAERILESQTFSRSHRLREFLSFVIRCSVENRTQELNEYSLGVQVFGKGASYNPNVDNIVRVTARQLRTKLKEYYSFEGALDPWRIEIPKGAYVPVLEPHPPAEIKQESVPVARRSWQVPALLGLGILAICGWSVAAWTWFNRPGMQPREAYLLSPLLSDKARPTTVVFDDPILPRAWRLSGKLMTLDDLVSGRYLNPEDFQSERGKFVRAMLGDNHFVLFSSAQMAMHISEVAHSHGVETLQVHSRTLQAEKMENGNFIFIGGVGANPWVGEIQKHLSFEHRIDVEKDVRTFVNRSPRPGEPASFESAPSNGRFYARVALLRNPFGTGTIALLGGTSREATEGAAQFALSQTGEDQVHRLCGSSIHNLKGLELILETKMLAGTTVSRTVVASRCTER